MLPRTDPKIDLNVQGTHYYHHSGCNNRESSKSLSVTRKRNGHVWHCFKCGASGFHPLVGFHSVEAKQGERAPQRPSRSLEQYLNGAVPYSGMSALSRDYLRSYFGDEQLSEHEAVEFSCEGRTGIRWKTARGYQERTLSGDGPKWKSYGGSDDFYLRGRGDLLVITEDVISARMVSQYTAALATLGTTVKDSLLPLIARYKYCAVWYDDDSSIVKRQQMQACIKIQAYLPCTVIHTGTDPKNVPDIPAVLKDVMEHFNAH